MSKPTGRRRDSPRWDRTGEKYGRLTITGYAGFDDRNKKHLWWVRCSCPRHRVFMVPAINMTSGRTRGCGCLAGADRIINRIGDTFGRLTVIGRGQTSPTTGIRWICMCTSARWIARIYSTATRRAAAACAARWLDNTENSRHSPSHNRKARHHDRTRLHRSRTGFPPQCDRTQIHVRSISRSIYRTN